jgi:hypothetical protein
MIITKNTQEIFKAERAELNERNDCVVRATAIALDIDYKESHSLYKSEGRESRAGVRGFQIVEVLKKALIGANTDTYSEMYEAAGWRRKKCPTLNQVMSQDKFKTGTHLILTTGHAITIKNGVVFGNNYEGGRCRVQGYITTENK